MTFKDHFSPVSKDYAQYRPGYPQALFEFVLQHVRHRQTAWDCATGSGQAAVRLAEDFERVVATDASSEQLNNAIPHPRIDYRVALAEDSGLEDHSIDLITVAQALHWFNFDKFYKEVSRVAREGAVFAAWSYGLFSLNNQPLDRVIHAFYHETVGPYWPPERVYTDHGYKTIPLPFKEQSYGTFEMEVDYTIDHIVRYFGTWSAVKNYQKALGKNPIPDLLESLQELWPSEQAVLRARTPIFLRLAEVDK